MRALASRVQLHEGISSRRSFLTRNGPSFLTTTCCAVDGFKLGSKFDFSITRSSLAKCQLLTIFFHTFRRALMLAPEEKQLDLRYLLRDFLEQLVALPILVTVLLFSRDCFSKTFGHSLALMLLMPAWF